MSSGLIYKQQEDIDNLQYPKITEKLSGEFFIVFKTNLPPKYQIDEEIMTVPSSATEKDLNIVTKREVFDYRC